jgi:replicative DNA helicase
MKLDVKIETEFLAAVVQDSKLLTLDILNNVDDGYFSVDSYKWFVKKLKERSWRIIAVDFLDQLLLEDFDDSEKINLYKGQLCHLYVRDLSYVEDAEKKFKTFIAYSIIKASTKEIVEKFERTNRIDYMLKEFSDAVDRSKCIIQDNVYASIDYAEDYEERQARRRQERDNPALNPVFLTGISGLDSQFKIKAPMIVDFFAPFKRYKSIFLNAMGFSGLLQGFNVLHVVYENDIPTTVNRYDSLFSQISCDRIASFFISQEEKEKMDGLFCWLNSWPARLKIFKVQPTQTTIPDIEGYIDNLRAKEGFKPDIVIIDYLNIIGPSKYDKEERLRQARVVWDIKHLADTYNVPVITASQATREAAQAERLEMKHRGKSVDISQGINMSIAINQTEEERKEGLIVLCPLFSRDFEIKTSEIVIEADLNKMLVSKDLLNLWNNARNYNRF